MSIIGHPSEPLAAYNFLSFINKIKNESGIIISSQVFIITSWARPRFAAQRDFSMERMVFSLVVSGFDESGLGCTYLSRHFISPFRAPYNRTFVPSRAPSKFVSFERRRTFETSRNLRRQLLPETHSSSDKNQYWYTPVSKVKVRPTRGLKSS